MHFSDTELNRLRALRPGQRTNTVLYHLLQPKVLGYWLFSEPKHHGIELSDCLFLWGDTVFLIEAKTREGAGPGSDAWIRERLKQASESISARADLLKSGAVSELRNPWHGVVPFDPARFRWYYGIAIMNHFSEPYEPRELAPDAYQSSKVPFQVFSLFDFAQLLRFQDTALDLIIYYELRAKFARTHAVHVHREFTTYQAILQDWVELCGNDVTKAREIQEFHVSRANALMQSRIATDDDYIALARAKLLDMVMGSVERKASQDPTGKRVGDPGHGVFVRSVEAVAELSLIRRSHYGRTWLTAATDAVQHGTTRSRSSYSTSRARSYLTCAFPATELDRESYLRREAVRSMYEHGTRSCLALGATDVNILGTFQTYLDWAKGDFSTDLPDDLVLDATGVFIDLSEGVG